MKLVLDTWRGVDINDGTNFVADFPENTPLVNPTTPVTVDMLDVPSLNVGRRHVGPTISIFVQPQSDYRDKREQLKRLFKTEEKFTFYTLTAHDEDDSDRAWSIQAAVLTAVPKDDAFIIVLAPKTHYWKSGNVGTTEEFTSSGETIDYISVFSDINVRPTITLTPTSQKADGYLYERWIMMRNNRSSAGLVDFDFGDSLDTAALVTAGKMRSDGFDVKLTINNTETPRWFGNFNTTDTKIWAKVQLPNTYPMVLKTALGTGALTEIVFKDTVTNRERFKKWPDEGTFVIGTEGFTYDEKDEDTLTISTIDRGYRGTTVATHATSQTVHLQTIDVKLFYGNASADDPEYDDTFKPTLDLDNSSNDEHIMILFGNSTGERTPQAVFTKKLGDSPETGEYTDTHGTSADPYVVAGMKAEALQVAGVWRPDTVAMRWSFTPAYKVDTIEMSGEMFKTVATAPRARIRIVDPTNKVTLLYLIPQPAINGVWDTWTYTSGSLITSNIASIRLAYDGSIGAFDTAQGMVEVQEVIITYDPNYIPLIAYGPENGTYDFDLTLQNLTTGQKIYVKRKVRMSPGTVAIDTDAHTIKVNGRKSSPGVTLYDTREWFSLAPGTNVIKVTEVGLNGMDVEIVGPGVRGV